MSIHQYLDLSTGHLPPSERSRLDQVGTPDERQRRPLKLPKTVMHGEGWWVNVPTDFMVQTAVDAVKAGCPTLANILNYAHERGCWWINFDVDAERLGDLPYFGDDETPQAPELKKFLVGVVRTEGTEFEVMAVDEDDARARYLEGIENTDAQNTISMEVTTIDLDD